MISNFINTMACTFKLYHSIYDLKKNKESLKLGKVITLQNLLLRALDNGGN